MSHPSRSKVNNHSQQITREDPLVSMAKQKLNHHFFSLQNWFLIAFSCGCSRGIHNNIAGMIKCYLLCTLIEFNKGRKRKEIELMRKRMRKKSRCSACILHIQSILSRQIGLAHFFLFLYSTHNIYILSFWFVFAAIALAKA